ncbi:4-phosphoerythronate dehydrogenase [Anaerotruncus colihominis DSM 17241]|jgi:glycerate dehydrogenase|uniref:4-phosphoerythronate dehydrogenase n=2 Tax=Anaerotruncus colihominis TaxID=169435 RepID=B0P9I7_9FIRM|nr:4-phosphoerythronate dehydrogenase [Anaerotruncus colihominis DSM 17241]
MNIQSSKGDRQMKIVVLDGYTENPGDLSWNGLESLGELTVYDRTQPDEIAARIRGAGAVYVNKVALDRETIFSAPDLKFIGVLATGYNVVDIAAARERGIAVCNIPTYGTAAVGQFAIAMLLEICHHVAHHSDAVHAGRWEQNADWCFWDYPLIELAGKTMGIIGFGRIGQTTGRIARALGMNVIAYDEYESGAGRALAEYTALDALFARSDVIALHCPLLPSTQGIINRENIAKMKDGVIILNNARGPLIVEQDLADALNSGKVYAAGLDVVSTEPIRGDNPLLKAKNCLITPHISWAPKESRQRLMEIAADNLRRFLEGSPVNVVNL